MANVIIDIPGVGKVQAENAASEETLLKLLAAFEKFAPGSPQGSTQTTNAQRNRASATRNEEENRQREQTKKSFLNSGGALANLTKSAIALGAQFATQYDEMARNPIAAGAGAINNTIDAVSGLTKATVGAIPFIGGFASAAAEAAATIAHVANDIFAKEFQKSVDMLHSFSKAGASFSGGMIEMRNTAHDAALNMTQFQQAAAASSEDFRNAGFTQAEGAKAMAAGMKASVKVIGKSGNTLRDEMLAMGYSYEEQGAIMAQYMSQQKASGNLNKMTTEDIARGTREYAKNLKVISDITGQDAKKLMEKARTESMRGALLGKLDAKQQEAYKQSYSTMMAMGPEMGPKLQQALTQVMAGGPVTDPIIAGNKDIMNMLKETSGQINSGNQDMVSNTQKNLSKASEAIRSHGESSTDLASLYGADSPVVQGMAAMQNAFRSFQLPADAAEKSATAAEKSATATDGLTKGFQKLTAQTTQQSIAMEEFVGSNLDTYAILAADAFKTQVDLMRKAINLTTGLVKDTSWYDKLTDFLQNSFNGIFGYLGEKLANGVEYLLNTGTDALLDKVYSTIANALLYIKDTGEKVGSTIADGLLIIKDFGEMVGSDIADALLWPKTLPSKVIDFATNFWIDIKTSVIELKQKIVNGLVESWNMVTKAISDIGDSILGFFKNITDKIANFNIVDIVKGGAKELWNSLLGSSTEARANGGPVNQGKPYLVGERGPEIVVPNSTGTVIPDVSKLVSNNEPSVSQVTDTVTNNKPSVSQVTDTVAKTIGATDTSFTNLSSVLTQISEQMQIQQQKYDIIIDYLRSTMDINKKILYAQS
jgi:hypothetical protein